MMLGLAFKRLKEEGRFNFNSFLAKGEFALAKTMIITRHVEKDLFSSESYDSITYVDTHLTDEKAKDIIDRLLPTIAHSTLMLMSSVNPVADRLMIDL